MRTFIFCAYFLFNTKQLKSSLLTAFFKLQTQGLGQWRSKPFVGVFDSNTLTRSPTSTADCIDWAESNDHSRVCLTVLTLFQLNPLMKEVILLLNTHHKIIFKNDCFTLLVVYAGIIRISLFISFHLSKFIFLWCLAVLFLWKLHISAQRINVAIRDIQLYILLIVFQLLESLLSPALTLSEYF